MHGMQESVANAWDARVRGMMWCGVHGQNIKRKLT